jgi:hypothetical protein
LHFYIKKNSKNLQVSQKKHNFAADFGVIRGLKLLEVAPAMAVVRRRKPDDKMIQFTILLSQIIQL